MTLNHKSTRTLTEHTYRLTDDSDHGLGNIVITFENGKFLKCDFPIRRTYTSENWAVLAEIEDEIQRLHLGKQPIDRFFEL